VVAAFLVTIPLEIFTDASKGRMGKRQDGIRRQGRRVVQPPPQGRSAQLESHPEGGLRAENGQNDHDSMMAAPLMDMPGKENHVWESIYAELEESVATCDDFQLGQSVPALARANKVESAVWRVGEELSIDLIVHSSMTNEAQHRFN